MTVRKVTAELADWIVGVKASAIPAAVREEGVRTFVNWLGCAVGGADHETADRALAAVSPFSGPREATVLGRSERLDVLHAALVNGITSHVLDYDDTHLKTIIHPAGPVASALLALAESRPLSGHDLLTALLVGVETPSTPTTTTAAGTSPAPRACSARRPRWDTPSASTRSACAGRSVSPPPSPRVCARCSAP